MKLFNFFSNRFLSQHLSSKSKIQPHWIFSTFLSLFSYISLYTWTFYSSLIQHLPPHGKNSCRFLLVIFVMLPIIPPHRHHTTSVSALLSQIFSLYSLLSFSSPIYILCRICILCNTTTHVAFPNIHIYK